MAKLTISRMSDATQIKQVDNAHAALEEALEAIFGIPDDVDITSPIFGTSPGGGKSVQSDGSIRGVMRFVSDGVESDAGDAAGIEFDDGSVRKKIAIVSSKVTLHEYDESTATWEQISDLENPGAGSGKLVDLSDVDITDDPLPDNKILKTSGGVFVLDDPASAEGITSFSELDEWSGPFTSDPWQSFDPANDIDKFIVVTGANSLGLAAAPEGLGAPWVAQLEAVASSKWRGPDWASVYNWDHQSFTGNDSLVSEDIFANNTAPTPDHANEFIYLESGIYELSMWYRAYVDTIYGNRYFRVQAAASSPATVVGPATIGTVTQAPVYLFPSGETTSVYVGEGCYMGTAMFIVTAAGNITIDVRQTASGVAIGSGNSDPAFYATLVKLK